MEFVDWSIRYRVLCFMIFEIETFFLQGKQSNQSNQAKRFVDEKTLHFLACFTGFIARTRFSRTLSIHGVKVS
jgi:uncharacterized membrane protein YsdA (DUF1294 family)